MIEDIIMALAKSGLILYAFIGFLVFIIAPYVFKWLVMLHNEKREDRLRTEQIAREDALRAEQIAREKAAKAEELEDEYRLAVAYYKSLPSWCSVCKNTTMVETARMVDDTFEYKRYTCPRCGNVKDVPIGGK